jgi:hypothetical protein
MGHIGDPFVAFPPTPDRRCSEYGVGYNLLHDGIANRAATYIVRAAVKSAPDALYLFSSPRVRLIGQLSNPLKFLRLGRNLNLIFTHLGAGSRLPTTCPLGVLNSKQQLGKMIYLPMT